MEEMRKKEEAEVKAEIEASQGEADSSISHVEGE